MDTTGGDAANRTHYQVLGVRATASTGEIRRAHRQLAYLLHPDRQSGTTSAERALAGRRMREVNVAWTTLSDPVRRADYDRTLARSTPTSHPSSTSGAQAGAASPAATPTPTGSGEWWDADDPDEAFARARAAEVDPDEPDLSVAQFWLLRRGAIVAMVVVGLVIFVMSAYAGRGSGETPPTSTPPVVANSKCVKLMQDNMAYTVSCDTHYDATIVREEPDVRSCLDEGLSYAVVASKSVCIDER